MKRDLVVIGASAGGIEALRTLLAHLPASFRAAILVTVHLNPAAPSMLPMLLGKAGPLTAVAAHDGMRIEPGRIHVSVPNHHLHVDGENLRLDPGARENGFRPAIDRLFRSAAVAYGARVIGVVLSGMRDDGIEGLALIKRLGGVALVQDPEEAVFAAMPKSAIANVKVDRVLPTRELAAAIHAYVEQDGPKTIEGEAMATRDPAEGEKDVELRTFLCPDCGGVVHELQEEGMLRYKCRVGHKYSSDSMVEGHARAVEGALWAAVNALLERRDLSTRIATRARSQGHSGMARRYEELATEADRNAEQIRSVLLSIAPGLGIPSEEGVRGNGSSAGAGP